MTSKDRVVNAIMATLREDGLTAALEEGVDGRYLRIFVESVAEDVVEKMRITLSPKRMFSKDSHVRKENGWAARQDAWIARMK